MNTVNQTALANLKQNKGKNILTGIAIFLTTLLIFIIPTVGFGQIDAQKAAINEIYPPFHGMYRDVDEKTAGELSHRAEIETIGLRQDVAQIPIEDGTCAMIYLDEIAWKLNKTELEEGYTPTKKEEIAVSQGILDELGISAGIGDTVSLPFQVIESGGVGYEKTAEFEITGLLPTSDDQKNQKTYFTLVSREFMEEQQPEADRRYRALFRILNADSMTSDEIEGVMKDIAADLGVAEANVVSNGDYLWANYVDPAFYTGIALVLLIVVLAGILTICSIYYISMVYKVQEYGKIKALGATKRQIRQMVFREGMLVAAIAVPVGLIVGSILSKIGFSYLVRSYAAGNMKEVMARLLEQNQISIWKPWIYLMAVAVTLLSVVISLRCPMQIVSRISPVEAMRYDGNMKTSQKKRKGHREMSLSSLTSANLSRNKKRTILTIVTLSLTGIFFMMLSTILSCADPKEIARSAMFDDLLVVIDSAHGDKMHPEWEWQSICKNNPLNDDLEKQILEIPGVNKITKSSELTAKLKELMDGDDLWETSIVGIPEEYAPKMEECIVQGKVTYEELLGGDKILMDKTMLHWAPDWKVGDTLHMILECGDGPVEKSFEIAAIADLPRGLVHYDSFLLPKEVVDELGGYSMDYYWSVGTDKGSTPEAEEQLRTILDNQEFLEMTTYEEEVAENERTAGFSAQIIYVFMAVLGGIGIMNLINTLINSIYVRRRELGILQAIGLSEKQMVQMLQLEGIFYTAGTLLLSLGIGSLAGYLTFLYAKENRILGILSYHYPVWQAVFLAAVVLVIQLLLTYLIIRIFRKQSMIERIRFSE